MHQRLSVRCLILLVIAASGLAAVGCDEGTLFDVNFGNPIKAELTDNPAFQEKAGPGDQFEVEVRLTGSDQRPIADWPVRWATESGSVLTTAPRGELSSGTTYTDSDGRATVTWTLGDEPETYYLDVWAAGVTAGGPGFVEPISPVPGPDVTMVVEEVE